MTEDIEQILYRSAKILDVDLDKAGCHQIACRSRGTPRIANRLLRRIRDFAQVKGDGRINETLAVESLDSLDVDHLGLDDMDKRLLRVIVEKFDGGPVGLNTLAVAVGEQGETIEEIYEPFLIQEGLLSRTPRGRVATAAAYKHLKYERDSASQPGLFSDN
jgi:Holliday junction DNA helicase RuvB